MKKLLFSIGSFALSLSAPNAAQLELPENAADVASSVSVPNNNPCVTKDVTNLSQDADASEDNVRTDSSQFVRQSSAENFAEETEGQPAEAPVAKEKRSLVSSLGRILYSDYED